MEGGKVINYLFSCEDNLIHNTYQKKRKVERKQTYVQKIPDNLDKLVSIERIAIVTVFIQAR